MVDKINIGDAISYGIDRVMTRGGAMLIAAYFLVQLAIQVSSQSLIMSIVSKSASQEPMSAATPFALDLPVAISGGLIALLMVVSLVLGIVAMRAVYADIDRVPTADHTRRLARTAFVLVVVGIIYCLAVLIGTIFLIIPGIFIAVSLVFVNVIVVIEEAGPIEALERSWELTSGNRIRLFALGLVIGGVGFIVGFVSNIVTFLSPVIGDIATMAVMGVLSLFNVAVLIGAYRQLADDADAAGSPSW